MPPMFQAEQRDELAYGVTYRSARRTTENRKSGVTLSEQSESKGPYCTVLLLFT